MARGATTKDLEESEEAGRAQSSKRELSSSDFPVSSEKPRRVFNKKEMVQVFRKFRHNKINM